MLRRLLRPLWILLALIFLLEAWLWHHLQHFTAAIVRLIPLESMKAAIRRGIERLSPAATLAVFAIPLMLLFPLKIAEVWLLAHRQWLAAIGVVIIAKLAGLGITAFIFDACRDKLLQMDWFRRLYELTMRLLERAHAVTEPIKRQARSWLWLLQTGRSGKLMRRLWRIRRRMQPRAAD